MRRSLLSLVVAALLAAALESRGLDTEQVVRKVQERYDQTRDFTANVKQEMTVASLGRTTSTEGTIAFKKPGKMRWELDHNSPQVIVADGATLWLYQPTEHQVLKTPFNAAFRAATPVSFLTGVGRIAQDFEATLDGTSADGQLAYLMLVPRHDSDSIGKLRLSVAVDSGEIRAAEIFDPFGNISRLQFSDIRRNQDLPDDRFVFQIPPGVDVISAPTGQ